MDDPDAYWGSVTYEELAVQVRSTRSRGIALSYQVPVLPLCSTYRREIGVLSCNVQGGVTACEIEIVMNHSQVLRT